MQCLIKSRDVEVIFDDGVSESMRDRLTGVLVSALAGLGRRARAAVRREGQGFVVSIDLHDWGVPTKLVLPAETLTALEVGRRLERATRALASPPTPQPTNL